MGKYSLIVISGFVFAFGVIMVNLNEMDAKLVDGFVENYEKAEARLAAHSAAAMSLESLRDSTTWRGGYAGVQVGEGTGGATLEDNSTDTTLSVEHVRITAGGSSGGAVDTVIVLAAIPTIPPAVHGGVSANSAVTTLGNLVMDGRDHDLNGAVVDGKGTMGVSTVSTFTQGGSSTGGGTGGGVDYPPTDPANPAIVETNATYTPATTPDEVFGYEEGVLKTMAQSGANGAQYVTDPAGLTFPLSGVTYVELGNGAVWQSMDFGASTGVLVVHNAWGNAKIKNLNSGTFKGLIVADDIEKIHMTIIGAVVSLTTTPSGNCIGNGSGEILYSNEALLNASSVSLDENGGVSVVWWRE